MKRAEAKRLLDRFLAARTLGKELYFDADEIDEILLFMEVSEDITYYDELLEQGLRLHPENSILKIRHARSWMLKDEYEKALKILNTIAEMDNQDLDTFRIECYFSLSQTSKAYSYIDQLIENKCEYLEEIFAFITPVLNDFPNNKEAGAFIAKGLKLFPESTTLREELGILYEDEGKIDEAIVVCNDLIDRNPFSFNYWFNLGRLYSLQELYEKAVEAFDFALTCDDSNDELLILKAYCLYMNESYSKAIDIYKEIGKDDKEWERVKPLVAECYIKLEDYEQAYQLLKPIIYEDDSNGNPSCFLNYIYCCVETDREAEGISILRRAATAYPDNVAFHSLENMIDEETYLLVTNTPSELFQELSNMIDVSETDYEIIFQAGRHMLDTGNAKKAAIYFERVEILKPDYPLLNAYLALSFSQHKSKTRHKYYYSILNPEELNFYNEEFARLFNENSNSSTASLEASGQVSLKDLIKDLLDKKENKN